MAGRRVVLLVAVVTLAAVATASGRTLNTVQEPKKPEINDKAVQEKPEALDGPKEPKETQQPKEPKEPKTPEEAKEPKHKPHPKDIVYAKLTKHEKLCVDKVMGRFTEKTLKPWDQCGGKGASCKDFGSERTHCHDEAFYDWTCPKGFVCERQGTNAYYWQCVEDKEGGHKHKGEEQHKHEDKDEHKHEGEDKHEEKGEHNEEEHKEEDKHEQEHKEGKHKHEEGHKDDKEADKHKDKDHKKDIKWLSLTHAQREGISKCLDWHHGHHGHTEHHWSKHEHDEHN